MIFGSGSPLVCQLSNKVARNLFPRYNFIHSWTNIFLKMRRFLSALVLALAVASIRGEEAAKEKEFSTQETASQAERDKLLDDLFRGYKTYSYPENSSVEFGLYIMEITVEEERNRLTSDVWLKYSWTDRRLSWDKEATGVSVLRVPPSMLWTPDITLYNSANQGERLKCWESNAIVFSTGNVIWIPPCHLETYCNYTLSRNPYGEQLCTLKFGSWTFDELTLNLDFSKGVKQADLSVYSGSLDNFDITTNKAERNVKTYDCCAEPYVDLTFTIGVTRRDESAQKCEN